MSGYVYRAEFFDYVDSSAGRSAARFLAKLALGFSPASVLDVGCGRGVWLAAWKRMGATTVRGVDGSYVDPATLAVDPSEFVAADLAAPVDLGARFDLVECLEVAEHLPEASAETLVSTLVRHGEIVLFSAATPGQGGEQHVNEQPLAYWMEKFAARGYAAFDHPRAAVRGDREIEPWYRFNALLFASPEGAARLSPAVRATIVAPGTAPRQYGTPWWRLRCGVLRLLPSSVVHRLARLKHRATS
jgi:SAM-dependent methyltransferase